jgi:hypothetical protein
MSFLTNVGQSPTDQFQPAIQEMQDNLNRLIWMIIIGAILWLLWMHFAH